jgi:putative hemolysin
LWVDVRFADLGELVPKRLALTRPEKVATIIARPMEILATCVRPIVYLLSVSTDTILRLFGVRQVKQPGVTVEEIMVMLEQGAEEGVFKQTEHELVTNVLNLDERHVGSVLTRRSDVVFLDVRDSLDANREKLRQEPHSVVPLCDGGLDRVSGFVRSTKVLERMLEGRELDLVALAEPALFVPETTTLMKLLEQFKRTHLPIALVVDEFGEVGGLVSLSDVVSSIVGDLPTEPGEEPSIVRRDDGSWLLDGALDLDTVVRTLDADAILSDEDRQHYHTLGGLTMFVLGRVPRTGDVLERGPFRFEIVDMDGNRVDRVLLLPSIRPQDRRHRLRPMANSQNHPSRRVSAQGADGAKPGRAPLCGVGHRATGIEDDSKTARTNPFRAHDSILVIRYRSRASSATMNPRAPTGVMT